MTDVAVADRLARLESLIGRLELVSGLAEVMPSAVNPDGTPGHVAAGELIESAWGNAVVDTLLRNAGARYTQASQFWTQGQSTTFTWPTRQYDSEAMIQPGGNTYTIPAQKGGTWSITAMVSSDFVPGAECPVSLNLNPARILAPAVFLGPGGRRTAMLTFVGRLNGTSQFSLAFTNNNAGTLGMSADLEARFLGF